ncbi:MAG TPA: DUF5677 domain-containing protein [Rhodocyclaceae bacterium]|nr:DUF5677 domain-containing protein [Rhodocyclaceae bacterium]
MVKVNEKIELLSSILQSQLELLNLTLFVGTQGPTTFRGELLSCSMGEAKKKTSQHIAMCAGQSTNTVLKCSDWRGIAVRDLYPIARSAVESFINAAYLVVEDDTVAERAVRWVKYRSWREFNRSVGNGDFSLTLRSESCYDEAQTEFAEFLAKGASREWCVLDTASRIRRIGELAGSKAGGRLLGAYANLYSVSSEIVHGSPYGVNYFFQTHHSSDASVDAFREATRRHVEDVLVDLCHGVAGYLSAFFRSQHMAGPYRAEQELFNRFLQAEGIEPQAIEMTE